MNTIYDLANWFLNKSVMSHKKLQKLCYYAVAWHYTLYDSILVHDNEFEAWVHGPVSPSLWFEYKDYGWNIIPQNDIESPFDSETNEFLEIVYNTYGDFSGHQLEALTHKETPWKETRGTLEEFEPSNEEISPEYMKKYYRSIYDTTQND